MKITAKLYEVRRNQAIKSPKIRSRGDSRRPSRMSANATWLNLHRLATPPCCGMNGIVSMLGQLAGLAYCPQNFVFVFLLNTAISIYRRFDQFKLRSVGSLRMPCADGDIYIVAVKQKHVEKVKTLHRIIRGPDKFSNHYCVDANRPTCLSGYSPHELERFVGSHATCQSQSAIAPWRGFWQSREAWQ